MREDQPLYLTTLTGEQLDDVAREQASMVRTWLAGDRALTPFDEDWIQLLRRGGTSTVIAVTGTPALDELADLLFERQTWIARSQIGDAVQVARIGPDRLQLVYTVEQPV